MTIEYNLYGCNEYTVQFQGDDFWFNTRAEAEAFIISVQEGVQDE